MSAPSNHYRLDISHKQHRPIGQITSALWYFVVFRLNLSHIEHTHKIDIQHGFFTARHLFPSEERRVPG